jgi:Histidine kinase-like ATPase domain
VTSATLDPPPRFDMIESFRLAAPHDLRVPALMRHEAAVLARAWELDAPTADLVELAASELVTNGVLHARTELWVTLARSRPTRPPGNARDEPRISALTRCGKVHITVADSGPGSLRLLRARNSRERGRGLVMLGAAGMRVEYLELPDRLKRVNVWTPTDIASRQAVCPCPCWADWNHKRAAPAHRCAEFIADEGHPATLRGERVVYCAPCAERARERARNPDADRTARPVRPARPRVNAGLTLR